MTYLVPAQQLSLRIRHREFMQAIFLERPALGMLLAAMFQHLLIAVEARSVTVFPANWAYPLMI
jgi:hypothetical protein